MARQPTQREADRLYREFGPQVYRRALRLLGKSEDAEEALQEVFLRVLSTEAFYAGKGELMGWLYRITTNHCLGQLRMHKRRRGLLQQHVVPTSGQRTAPAAPSIDLMTIRWLLAQADEQQAQAAIYVYLDGLTYDEAAPLLGVSRSTVGNLIERFQQFCIERLQREDASAEASDVSREEPARKEIS